ncbi:hypothetical protein [Streptomyces sp. NPDC088760]|uniref:hypothetical protein n=1 Tax=Streptomyces sp. NPDC088760 TaxID=3365890 RepID=UPI003830383F
MPTGDDALSVDQTILRRLRAAGHGIFFTADQTPNGWTETFDATRVTSAPCGTPSGHTKPPRPYLGP